MYHEMYRIVYHSCIIMRITRSQSGSPPQGGHQRSCQQRSGYGVGASLSRNARPSSASKGCRPASTRVIRGIIQVSTRVIRGIIHVSHVHHSHIKSVQQSIARYLFRVIVHRRVWRISAFNDTVMTAANERYLFPKTVGTAPRRRLFR